MNPQTQKGPSKAVAQMVEYGTDAMLTNGIPAIVKAMEEGAEPHYAAGSMVGELLFRLEDSIIKSGKQINSADLREAAKQINAEVGRVMQQGGALNITSQEGATNFAQKAMVEAVGTYGRHVKQAQGGAASNPSQVPLMQAGTSSAGG